jgi:16S rRNA (cytosine967-C5)-methyltransferase
VRREAVTADEIGGLTEAVTSSGDLRTLPFMDGNADPGLASMDGFFAARLVRAQ